MSQLLNNTWLIIYPLPFELVFVNRYDFKQDVTPLLNYFDIKPVLTTIKNPQANPLVKQVYQVVLNMLVTKSHANKFFNYIYVWGETLASIAWVLMSSYHRTIQVTPVQAVFGRDMIFNLASVVKWRVITSGKRLQVDIDNVQENDK